MHLLGLVSAWFMFVIKSCEGDVTSVIPVIISLQSLGLWVVQYALQWLLSKWIYKEDVHPLHNVSSNICKKSQMRLHFWYA